MSAPGNPADSGRAEVNSTLEEIRARYACTRGPITGNTPPVLFASASDVPRLLTAIEAVLKLHRPVGDGCAAGGCTWSWPCPTIRAISRELTKGER